MAVRRLKNYKPTRFKAETSNYNKEAADYAVLFIESLKHTKGSWYRTPLKPPPGLKKPDAS